MLRTTSMPARRSRPGMRRCGSIPERRARCGRPAKPPVRQPSNARWTRRRSPAGSIRWNFACATTPRPTRRRASRSRPRRCANAMPQGAERFGWAGRPLEPRQMRDDAGRLVGWGMGSALFPAPMFQAEARATLRSDGTALVETSGRRHGPGRLDRAGPDRRRRAGTRYRQGRVPLRLVRPSRRRHRRRLRAYRHGRQRALQCRRRCRRQSSPSLPPTTRTLRCSARAMPASRRAAGGFTTAGIETRSESYADILLARQA